MPTGDLDVRVRLAAFDFLGEQVRAHGDVLSARILREGFVFEDQRVQLKGPQGIFKPAILPEMPLSITTAPPDPERPRPYDDSFAPDWDGLDAKRPGHKWPRRLRKSWRAQHDSNMRPSGPQPDALSN